MYVDSLIKLNSYNKAIRFAYECEDILHEAREKYIVRAVVANFTKHGLSQSGLAVFNNDFTIQEAIDVLMRHFIATDYPLILSLIILYAYNDELIKSTYLYSIFHTRAEVGFVRTYSQFRTIYLRRISGNITNHYEVMQLAFNSLSMVKLLNFIKWAGTITIPNYTDYSPSHVFSVFYDSLLKNSEDANTWEKSYNYFIINKEKNAWLICVCGTIMMHKFGIPYDSLTRDSFVVILGDISHSRVARSNAFGLTKLGAKVTLAGPSTLVSNSMKSLGVEVETDIPKAIKDADVVMGLRIQFERQKNMPFPSLREYSSLFGVNSEILKYAKDDVLVMHPGPVNRGVELSTEVIDGKNSVITVQVKNGVAVRMAVLKLLTEANSR